VAYQNSDQFRADDFAKEEGMQRSFDRRLGDDYEIFGRSEPQDLSEDPERRYARCEKEELLKRAMLQLTPGLRDAIQLQQAKECSLRELAERLGISLSAAKSRLLRARLALQGCLQ
jgi:RNA polymerase sigma factor (sigma-70 family)